VFTEHHDQLNPGDKIVLYTDGISEARRNKELFDLDGIEHLLIEHNALSPDQLAKTLLQSATDWAGGKLQDDAAVVIVAN